MSLQRLEVEISEPLPGKYLGNCATCSWELWSTDQATLREAWEKHRAQKHGESSRQGRLL